MNGSQERWHVNKEINISNLITIILACFSVMAYVLTTDSEQDRKIASNTQDITYVKDQRTEDVKRNEKQFDIINTKLDDLLKQSNRNP